MSVQEYKIKFGADLRAIDEAEKKLLGIGLNVERLSKDIIKVPVDIDTLKAGNNLNKFVDIIKKINPEMKVHVDYQDAKDKLSTFTKKQNVLALAMDDTANNSVSGQNINARLQSYITQIRNGLAEDLDMSAIMDEAVAYVEVIKKKYGDLANIISGEILPAWKDVFNAELGTTRSGIWDTAKGKHVVPQIVKGELDSYQSVIKAQEKVMEGLRKLGAVDIPKDVFEAFSMFTGQKGDKPLDLSKWSKGQVDALAELVRIRKLADQYEKGTMGIETPDSNLTDEEFSSVLKQHVSDYKQYVSEMMRLSESDPMHQDTNIQDQITYYAALASREENIIALMRERNKLAKGAGFEQITGISPRDLFADINTVRDNLSAGVNNMTRGESFIGIIKPLLDSLALDAGVAEKDVAAFRQEQAEKIGRFIETMYVSYEDLNLDSIKSKLYGESHADVADDAARRALVEADRAAAAADQAEAERDRARQAADETNEIADEIRGAQTKLNEALNTGVDAGGDSGVSERTEEYRELENAIDGATHAAETNADTNGETGHHAETERHIRELEQEGEALDSVNDKQEKLNETRKAGTAQSEKPVGNAEKKAGEDAEKAAKGFEENAKALETEAAIAEKKINIIKTLGSAEKESGDKSKQAAKDYDTSAESLKREEQAAKKKAELLKAAQKTPSQPEQVLEDEKTVQQYLSQLGKFPSNSRYLNLEMRMAERRPMSSNMLAELQQYEQQFKNIKERITTAIESWDSESRQKVEEILGRIDTEMSSRREEYLEKRVDSLTKMFAKAKSQMDSLNLTPEQGGLLAGISNKIANINIAIARGPSNGKSWAKEELQGIINEINNAESAMSDFGSKSGIFASTGEVGKLLDKVNITLSKYNMDDNTRARLEEMQQNLRGARDEADQLNQSFTRLTKADISKLNNDFASLSSNINKTNLVGKNVFETIASAASTQTTQLIARWFSLSDLIRYARQMITTVTQIDTAMKELQKVSGETASRIDENFRKSADTAKDLGASIKDVISSTADWSRLGYDIDAAEDLARVTTMYQNIALGIDQKSASEYLVSTLKGFQMQADEAESIIDKINEVAQNWPIDQAGIGEALQRSAAAFSTSGTSLDKAIALVTSSNSVLQNPEKVGTLWTTLSARIRGRFYAHLQRRLWSTACINKRSFITI